MSFALLLSSPTGLPVVKAFAATGPHWQINGGANDSGGGAEGCLVPKCQLHREGQEPVAGLCGNILCCGEKNSNLCDFK